MIATSSHDIVYPRRWWILLVIALAVLAIVLSSSTVGIALPTIQRELGTTMTDLQWIMNAYLLAFAGLMLTMGALGDRIGRATVMLVGVGLFAVANVAAALARSAPMLIALRAVMGAASAMILPQTLAIIAAVFPEEERGKAIGVWAGLNSLGVAAGPILGGLLVETYAWTSIFLVNLPVGAAALLAGLFLLPNSRAESRPRPDLVGTVLSIMAVSALIYGLIEAGGRGWSDRTVLVSLGAAAILIAVFVIWERRSSHPMLDLSLFRRRRFSAGVGALTVMSLALVGLTFTLSLFMQFVRGYGAFDTGVRLLPLATGVLIGAGGAHRAVKRVGTAAIMVVGFLGTAVVAALATASTLDTPYAAVGAALFALGLFLGYIAAPATATIMNSLPPDQVCVGSAINTVSRSTAGARYRRSWLGAQLGLLTQLRPRRRRPWRTAG